MTSVFRLIAHPYLLLALAGLCWAGNHVVGRAIAGQVPPLGLNAGRWMLASAILLPFALPHLRRDWPRLIERKWAVLFLAVGGGAVFGTGQFVGLIFTSALNVALLNSVAPALIIVASAILFGDRVVPVQLAGVLVSLVGVLAIIASGDPRRLLTLELNPGDIIIFANMLLWAVYSTSLRLRPAVHWLSFTAVVAVVSALANLAGAVVEGVVWMPIRPSWSAALAIGYTGVFSSVVAYVCWNRGIELIGPQRAGAFLHLIPVYGAFLAWLFLGEHLQWFHAVGLALILAGVALAARRR